jgi:hypothetical protein
MNSSYSKIRHIQESNILLERRLLNEQLTGQTQYTIGSASFDKNKNFVYGTYVVMSDGKKYGITEIVYNVNCETNKKVKDPHGGKMSPVYYGNQQLPNGCIVGIKKLNIECDRMGCKPTDKYKSPYQSV